MKSGGRKTMDEGSGRGLFPDICLLIHTSHVTATPTRSVLFCK
jgi:hypothetical protein